MDAVRLLTQDDLRRWRACPRHFWLHRRLDAVAADDGTLSILSETEAGPSVVAGPAPDEALRASFPGAIVIDTPHTPAQWAEATQRTAACLNEGLWDMEGQALFGACLASDDGAMVRIDVLAAGARGVRLFKVRFATVGNEADVDEVALWAHVAARCGLRVQSVTMLVVDTDFIYPGHQCYSGLFREVDLAPVLGSRPVPNWLVNMRTLERGPMPEATPGPHCHQGSPCGYLERCGSPPLEGRPHLPDSLEVVGRDLAAELRQEGHTNLLKVAPSRMPDERRRRALRAIQQGAPELDPAVADVMRALPYPRFHLRIDTIGFATPIWSGTRPYQVLPFQWNCDVQASPDQLVRHAFLAGNDGDPRRAFAESLLQALGSSCPILAYNAGFERNRIQELALKFEDLATELEALLPRIVDLFHVARAHYYHPSMCGSWSFKSIYRAIAPELHADRFDCPGADTPQIAFAQSLQRSASTEMVRQRREALLAYGRVQTQALRRMVEVFEAARLASTTQT